MSGQFTYGVVIGGVFHSNRIKRRTPGTTNGIYSLDPAADDIWATLNLADISEATKFFRRNNKFKVIRGVSFHDGIIPDNPVVFTRIPINVIDGQFEEFEYVEVIIGEFGCYYLQTLSTQESYALFNLKDCFDNKGNVSELKELTPPMRVVYSFHLLEKLEIEHREAEVKRHKEEKEPIVVIKNRLVESGANVISIIKKRSGFEVVWELAGHTINSLVGVNYQILEAGFCTSGGDRSQSVRSIPNLLETYVNQGSYIHKTRST